jgi:hypothetical protein
VCQCPEYLQQSIQFSVIHHYLIDRTMFRLVAVNQIEHVEFHMQLFSMDMLIENYGTANLHEMILFFSELYCYQ